MAKFLEHIVIGLAWVAVIGAGAYFGGPLIWSHFWGSIQSGDQAKVALQAEGTARSAEIKAANTAQASCSTEVAHAMDAAKAIAAASKPQTVAQGQPRPMITADQIRAMMQ